MYIQFLDAVFHYTKDVRAKDTRLEDFLGYLDSQKLVYPLAQAFLSKSSADDFNAIDHSSIREEVDEDELPSDDEGVLPSNIAQGLDPTPFQQFIDRASEEMQQPIPRTQRYTTVPEPGMAWPLGDNARTTTQPARQSVRVERVPIWDEVLTQQVTASEPEFNDGWEEE